MTEQLNSNINVLNENKLSSLDNIVNQSDTNSMKNKISNDVEMKKLIKTDYKKNNERALSVYSNYGLNMLTLQTKLVTLGCDLGKFGPKGNGVDGDFGTNTFVGIIFIQKTLGLKPTGIVDLKLLKFLYPKTFRTLNKNEGRGVKEMSDYVMQRVELYREQVEQSKQKVISDTKKQKEKYWQAGGFENLESVIMNNLFSYKNDIEDISSKFTEPEIDNGNILKINKNPLDSNGLKDNLLNENKLKLLFADIKSYPFERNPETKVTQCAKTNRLNFNDLFRIKIPWQTSVSLQNIINKGGIEQYKKWNKEGFNIPTNIIDGNEFSSIKEGQVIQVLAGSNSNPQYGHTFPVFKKDGQLYAIDPYSNNKNRKPFLLSEHPKFNLIKKGVVYDTNVEIV